MSEPAPDFSTFECEAGAVEAAALGLHRVGVPEVGDVPEGMTPSEFLAQLGDPPAEVASITCSAPLPDHLVDHDDMDTDELLVATAFQTGLAVEGRDLSTFYAGIAKLRERSRRRAVRTAPARRTNCAPRARARTSHRSRSIARSTSRSSSSDDPGGEPGSPEGGDDDPPAPPHDVEDLPRLVDGRGGPRTPVARFGMTFRGAGRRHAPAGPVGRSTAEARP